MRLHSFIPIASSSFWRTFGTVCKESSYSFWSSWIQEFSDWLSIGLSVYLSQCICLNFRQTNLFFSVAFRHFRWCELFNKLFRSGKIILTSSIVSRFTHNEEVAQNDNGVQLKQFVSKEYSSYWLINGWLILTHKSHGCDHSLTHLYFTLIHRVPTIFSLFASDNALLLLSVLSHNVILLCYPQ